MFCSYIKKGQELKTIKNPLLQSLLYYITKTASTIAKFCWYLFRHNTCMRQGKKRRKKNPLHLGVILIATQTVINDRKISHFQLCMMHGTQNVGLPFIREI